MRETTARIAIMLVMSMVCVVACVGYAAPADTASPVILDNKEPGKSETAIGCLVADAFRAAMHTDVALVSAGDLKSGTAPIAHGKAQPADLVALLAYPDDSIVVMALDGGMIRQALETSVSASPRPGLSFLQISGVQFSYDATKPIGSRVSSVSVGGSTIVDGQAYTVAMPNSLAGGALGYWKVWSKRNIVSKSSSITCTVAVEQFLKTNTKLDYSTLGRILAK